MKTFKQYLEEKWKTETLDSRIYGKRTFARNQKDIDGNPVDIHFSGNADHDYNLEYTVNATLNKEHPVSSNTGKRILQHVGKSINTFVRHMKPKSIGFQSKYDRRIDLHNKLAERLARNHNGRVETTETPGGSIRHTVHFDGKNK